MTDQLPLAGPDRERLFRKLESDLARFRRVPSYRREAEHADQGEQTCLALLRELGVGPPAV